MKYKGFQSKTVSLATVLSVSIVLELFIYALINAYWRSSVRGGGLGGGLLLDGVVVLLSTINVTLFLMYLARVIFWKSKFTPLPIVLGLLCLWLGMLLFR
jgi:hypothetical protein